MEPEPLFLLGAGANPIWSEPDPKNVAAKQHWNIANQKALSPVPFRSSHSRSSRRLVQLWMSSVAMRFSSPFLFRSLALSSSLFFLASSILALTSSLCLSWASRRRRISASISSGVCFFFLMTGSAGAMGRVVAGFFSPFSPYITQNSSGQRCIILLAIFNDFHSMNLMSYRYQ